MARTVQKALQPWPDQVRAGRSGREYRLAAMLRTIIIALCALLIGCAWASPAAAQTSITVDPATAVEAAGASVTFSHTVGTGSNRLLLVSVAIERNDATVSAITYAGQPLSFLGRLTDPGVGATLEIWGRIAPTSGTNQLSVTLSNTEAVVVGAISFANVDQANAIAAGQLFGGSSGTTASGSIASATDQLVIGTIAANDEVGSVTAGAGQTSRWNVVNASDVIGAGSTRTGLAGSTAMSYTFSNSGRWVIGVIALRQVSPLIVSNTNDSGPGSLRNAITYANTQATASTVSFAIPGAGPHTITLSSALPNLTANNLAVDGTTQSGTQCRDLWAGNGHDLRINLRGGGFDGFRLAGTNQTIKGLSLTNFDNAITTLAGSSAATIQCNYLGLLANGTSSGNSRGVLARGASARIGGLDAGQGNVISANSIVGVVTEQGSTDTAIRGNFIGTDPTGMTARANTGGINNFFGTATWRDITYNLISGNGNRAAIMLESDDSIQPSTDTIRIQRNVIGFNRTISARLPNGTDHAAIAFPPGSIGNALIGGLAATEGNFITASRDAIVLHGVSNIAIQGNTIARSGSRGIWMESVGNVTVGGSTSGQGNMIGGNGSDAIIALAGSSNVTILGNLIQPITITGGTFANGGAGIALYTVSNVVIGDGSVGGRNVIGGNPRRAVEVGQSASGLTINGNYVGTDATGNVAVSNGQSMDAFTRDAIAFGFGTFTGINILNNVIGGHAGALVEFWDSTATNVVIQGNSFGVGTSGASITPSDSVEPNIFAGGPTRNYSNMLIGGSAPGQGNLMANSGSSGIRLESTGSDIRVIGNTIRNNAGFGVVLASSTRAAIVGNRIFVNGLTGIDLGEDWITPNDPGDGDSGSNDLLNFPQAIRAVVTGPNTLAYTFTLDAPAAANGYRIEFFANAAADPSGFGEGERLLGHVDIAHAGGAQAFTGTLTTLEPVSIGDIIAATTTRRTAGGSWDITSEFSAVATADGVAQLAVAITSQVFDPPSDNPFATPGNDVLLTTTVTNNGTGSTDADSVFAVIAISPQTSFYNADTPALGGIVGFASGAPSLTFDPANDLRFSNAASAPQSLAQCTYTPAAGYDPQVRYVCLNPKGTLPTGGTQGQVQVQMRLGIN
jgi:parallel beta-helix repeat protein